MSVLYCNRGDFKLFDDAVTPNVVSLFEMFSNVLVFIQKVRRLEIFLFVFVSWGGVTVNRLLLC